MITSKTDACQIIHNTFKPNKKVAKKVADKIRKSLRGITWGQEKEKAEKQTKDIRQNKKR